MAEQKFNFNQSQDFDVAEDTTVKQELDPTSIKFFRERSKKKLEAREKQIYDRYQNYKELYGEEDFRTEMMVNFLYVTEMIEEIIDLQEAFQDIEFFFNEAMGIIDDNMNISQQMMRQQMATDYSFFARWKQKREIKKAQRNNINRIKLLTFKIETMVSTITGMSSEMKTMMIATKKALEKARFTGDKKKTKGTAAPETKQDNTAILSRFEKKFGSGDGGAPTSTTTTKTTNNGGTAPTNGGSVSDIDDIV